MYLYLYADMDEGPEHSRYEPLPRWGHVSVVIGSKLYLWGGRIEDFSDESKKEVSVMSTQHLVPISQQPRSGVWGSIITLVKQPLYVTHVSYSKL